MSNQDIDKLKEDVQILQDRMGGAEYLVKILIQKMHTNEIKQIENDIKSNINKFGANSAVAKILEESLRLLGK
ncbi:hypothetical protein HII27_21185 [Kluyvera sp. SCKS090646]|uniref:Uncharacterized protein n=1 Tax=Kluyvera sichuanensis TaxID=2725494 RepID=A0ABR6RYK2_9ENTR|nr:hypothetical protein [Kluyvera sichuanensis]MBC1188218.1 hypothetical protein [Kluyvera sichuanensis]HDG1697542.1 hypothetical protein [Kluyvera ascorbata]